MFHYCIRVTVIGGHVIGRMLVYLHGAGLQQTKHQEACGICPDRLVPAGQFPADLWFNDTYFISTSRTYTTIRCSRIEPWNKIRQMSPENVPEFSG